MRRAQLARVVIAVVVALWGAGCSRHDQRLQQHRKALESLGSTATAIAEAWLGGSVSGTYTRTAFEQTYQLVEQERTALAASPGMLADPRGAQLSQSAERLSRLLAAMIADVASADAASIRTHVAEIPIRPAGWQ